MRPIQSRGIASKEQPGYLVGNWFGIILYCGLSFGLFYLALTFREQKFLAVLVTGFFALWGFFGLVILIFKTLDYMKFGEVRFAFAEPWPSIGGKLRGELFLPGNARAAHVVKAQLECSKVEYSTDNHGHTNRYLRRIWYQERVFPIRRSSVKPSALIEIPIPDHAGTESGIGYEWELKVHADVPGIDLRRTFDIKVLKAPPGQVFAEPAAVQAVTARPAIIGADPVLPAAVAPDLTPHQFSLSRKPAQTPHPVLAPPDSGPNASLPILIGANLIPLAGVAFLDWPATDIVMLYWFEAVIVGLMNVLRIITAWPVALLKPKEAGTGVKPGELMIAKVLLCSFFIVHYGGFCYVSGSELDYLVSRHDVHLQGLDFEELLGAMLRSPSWLVSILCLLVSHLLSFLWNYLGKGEYQRVNIGLLMIQPYRRILVTMLIAMLGGAVVSATESGMVLMVMFVIAKIAADVYMHKRERQILGPGEVAASE